MKKILFISSLFLLLTSCGNEVGSISEIPSESKIDSISEDISNSISEDISDTSISEIESISEDISEEISELPSLEYGEGIMCKEKAQYDSDGVLFQKNVYVYNSNLDIVQDDCYIISYDYSELIFTTREVYEYNDANLITFYAQYQVKGENSFVLAHSYSCEYDENNHLIERNEHYNDQPYILDIKETYEYENNVISKCYIYVSEMYESIDDAITYLSTIITFTSEENVAITTMEYFDTTGEKVDAYSQTIDTLEGNVLTSIDSSYVEGVENSRTKYVITYNDNGDVISQDSYYYDVYTSIYSQFKSEEYSYDEDYKILKSEITFYEFSSTSIEKTIYEYDEENRLTKETIYNSNYDDGNSPYTTIKYIY